MTDPNQQIEASLLGALLRDRFLIAKVVNEGFRPQLLHAKPATVLAEAILGMYGSRDTVIDGMTVRAWLSERGLLTPEVSQLCDQILRTPPPALAQVLTYVDVLKLRESRHRLARLHSLIGAYLRQEGEFKG